MIKDGGTAFPITQVYMQDDIPGMMGKEGMSKRYWTAVMAMQGMLASVQNYGTDLEVVKCSYRYADEMIKAEGESND